MSQELCEDSQEIHPYLGEMHILLFDPEKSTLAYTKSMLKQAFYTVISTGDQSLALKMLEENIELINLIIIEDKPQEMDCITFIKKIKATMESIPIVLLSNNEVYLSASAIQIGACRVISKPIDSTEVKSLRKLVDIWRKKAYYNRLENAVEDIEKQAMPIKSDIKGKGKLVPDVNGESKHDLSKKRNHEKSEADFDVQDKNDFAAGGYERKKTRFYTQELHKKCLELAQNRKRILPKATCSTPRNPFIPSTMLLNMIKNNAGKNSIENNNIYGVQFSRSNTDNGISKIQHGFPANKVMESKSFHYLGEKKVIDNDLKRFSNLVDKQATFLASNGEFMWKKHLEKSGSNASLYPLTSAGSIPSVGFSLHTKPELRIEEKSQSHWVDLAMGEEEVYPVCEGLDEVSIDKFFEGVFDNHQGSTSSVQEKLGNSDDLDEDVSTDIAKQV